MIGSIIRMISDKSYVCRPQAINETTVEPPAQMAVGRCLAGGGADKPAGGWAFGWFGRGSGGAFAGSFGGVETFVGFDQERAGGSIGDLAQADQAGGDADGGDGLEGPAELVNKTDQLAGQRVADGMAMVWQNDDKLVTATAKSQVLVADAGADELADGAEQFIAGGVAEGVVEGFEIVQVEQ